MQSARYSFSLSLSSPLFLSPSCSVTFDSLGDDIVDARDWRTRGPVERASPLSRGQSKLVERLPVRISCSAMINALRDDRFLYCPTGMTRKRDAFVDRSFRLRSRRGN